MCTTKGCRESREVHRPSEASLTSEWGGGKGILGAQVKNGCTERKGEAGIEGGATGRRLVMEDAERHVSGLELDSNYDGLGQYEL